MFNFSAYPTRYRNTNVLGGYMSDDYGTHKTLYAGVDPADPSRALIRKLVQVNEHTYCYEETTITPNG